MLVSGVGSWFRHLYPEISGWLFGRRCKLNVCGFYREISGYSLSLLRYEQLLVFD